jgi:fluoride exporter
VRYIWVALAGAIGCTLRYAIDLRVDQSRFPWATLAINLSGAFVLALFLTLALGRVSVEVMTPISIGLLGGYTTFSTFAFESFTMSRNGRPATALLYIAISVVGGVCAASAGYALAKVFR